MTRIRLGIPRLLPLLAAAALLNGPPLRADDKALPSDLALAAHDTAGFVSVRVGDLMDSAAGKEFLQQLHKDKETAGDLLADLHRELVVPPADVERLTLVLDTQVLIVRTTKPYDRDKMLDALGGEARVKRVMGKTVYLGGDERGLMQIDDNVFVRGPVGRLEQLLTPQPVNPESQEALGEALELAAGKHQVTVGVNPLAYLLGQRRTQEESFKASAVTAPASPPPPPPPPAIEKRPQPCDEPPAEPAKPGHEPDAQELFKEMPQEALPFKPLFQARCITLTLDLDDGLQLEGRATYADKALAADGETSVKTTLYVLRELLPTAGEELVADPESAKQLQPLFRQLQEALRTATVRVEGTTVTVSAQAKVDPAAVAGMVLRLHGSADDIRSRNNLKQIALAMINFSDANGFMPPPAICGKDGKPLLSWRVAILPYIEQGNLYNQFKLDEPWDSPNNKPLLARMPKIYAPIRGKTKQPYSTFYQVFVGPGAPFQVGIPGPGVGLFAGDGAELPGHVHGRDLQHAAGRGGRRGRAVDQAGRHPVRREEAGPAAGRRLRLRLPRGPGGRLGAVHQEEH